MAIKSPKSKKKAEDKAVDQNEENEILIDLESEEQEVVRATEEEIVKKYDEGQARIVVQRNDFLIPNILQMVKEKDILNLSPEYQRRKRWGDTKRSHLIECKIR